MRGIRWAWVGIVGVFCCAVVGCRKAPAESQIVALNQSIGTAEVYVAADPGAGINAPDMAAGERRILMTGSGDLVVRTVKVVVKRRQTVFSPNTEVSLGKCY